MSAHGVGLVGLWSAAIGTGVMAGVYFTFSSFVMRSLEKLPRTQGIAAMQSINRVILSSSFMPLFFGTTVLSAALAAWSLFRWGQQGSRAMLAGGMVYVFGMFVCTAACNVPLNNVLDAVHPSGAQATIVWSDYLHRWTRVNHLRTLASAMACGLFIAAITAVDA
jgi:uncharacterized membrane protein